MLKHYNEKVEENFAEVIEPKAKNYMTVIKSQLQKVN